MLRNHTLLLTGIPRSGTTLLCSLLNEIADTVALVEPIAFAPVVGRAGAVAQIDTFVKVARLHALARKEAITKHVGGKFPGNTFEAPRAASDVAASLRKCLATHGTVAIDKPLTPNFTLAIKHPAEFSALAPEIVAAGYPLYAVVRNPLAVLAAWQTVDTPIQRGRMPMAEIFCPDLAAELDGIPDRIERQAHLLRWLLRTYARLPAQHIVRHEDLLAAPAACLSRLAPSAPAPHGNFEDTHPKVRYPSVNLVQLAAALRPFLADIEPFYPDYEETVARWIAA